MIINGPSAADTMAANRTNAKLPIGAADASAKTELAPQNTKVATRHPTTSAPQTAPHFKNNLRGEAFLNSSLTDIISYLRPHLHLSFCLYQSFNDYKRADCRWQQYALHFHALHYTKYPTNQRAANPPRQQQRANRPFTTVLRSPTFCAYGHDCALPLFG